MALGKFVNSELCLRCPQISDLKVIPLPESMSVCIFSHVEIILRCRYSGDGRKVPTLKLAFKSQFKFASKRSWGGLNKS